MRAREPFAQLMGGFNRRGSVKRHERGRDTGETHDVGAPSIVGDGRDLDQIGASSDGFFEAMNGRGHSVGKKELIVWKRQFYASRDDKQAKRATKPARTTSPHAFFERLR